MKETWKLNANEREPIERIDDRESTCKGYREIQPYLTFMHFFQIFIQEEQIQDLSLWDRNHITENSL